METPIGVMPPAASRVYFKFYKCENCPEHERYMVKPVYAPLSKDDSMLDALMIDKER